MAQVLLAFVLFYSIAPWKGKSMVKVSSTILKIILNVSGSQRILQINGVVLIYIQSQLLLQHFELFEFCTAVCLVNHVTRHYNNLEVTCAWMIANCVNVLDIVESCTHNPVNMSFLCHTDFKNVANEAAAIGATFSSFIWMWEDMTKEQQQDLIMRNCDLGPFS